MGRIAAVSATVIAVSALTLSCDMSSSLLSDAERNSLYVISLNSSDGKAIIDGSIVASGSGIVVDLSKLPGASDPAAVEISLESAGGKAAGLRAQTVDFMPSDKVKLSIADEASQVVESIEDPLPALVVPGSIPAGTFEVSVSVLGADGSVLQSSRVTVFALTPEPAVESVTSFPPAVEPGAPVLLGLALARASEEGEGAAVPAGSAWDPWIVWSFDGRSFAEGPLSAGLDETVWQAPRIAGAYSVTAQVYPAAPIRGKSFPFHAAARQDLRVMAMASPGGSGDDFADPLSFLCLLRLDGDFTDSGTRPRIAQPEPFGSPRLDVYASGFGYRFGAAAGVRIPGLMPPSQEGRLSPFSVIVRLDPDSDRGDGVIARFATDDGGYSLAIGLKDWKPYAEFAFEGKAWRSSSAAGIPRAPLTLEAVFRPEGERLSVSWRAEGERIESSSIPLPPPPPALASSDPANGAASGAMIGGPQSLPGVYDGFGLSAGSGSPAFRLASRRKWKAALVLAEGFEDGTLPRLSVASGGASAASGSLSLAPGASLSLDPAFDPAAGALVEVAIVGDKASARLDFMSPGGARAFTVTGTGEVLDAEGARLGVLEARPGRLSIGISSSDGGYIVASGGSASVSVPGDPSSLALALRREGGIGALSIESVVARRASAPAVASR